jgi:formylglycine-generating enzyme required for sulfatase activity
MYPRGATPQDVIDMAGNVWEWCINKYEKPGTAESLRIDNEAHGQRVLRGGSWHSRSEVLRASFRNWFFADARYNDIGFRLAQDIP